MDYSTIAKTFLITGAVIMAVGLVILVLGKTGLPFGNLPGDVRVEGKRVSFFFPVVTCIVISIVLTVLINVIIRFLGK